MPKDYKRIEPVHVVIIAILSVFAIATTGLASSNDGLLKIYFLDVGQGDSGFIVTPSGQQILIDGGPSDVVISKISSRMPFYDKDIDVLIASHKHSDHISGLMNVLDRYDVKNIVDTKIGYASSEVSKWDQLKRVEGANEIEAKAGGYIDLGEGIAITFLHPDSTLEGKASKNPNDDSIVAMLQYKNFRVLFVGDAGAKVENAMMASGINLSADVLKVGHHGSATSTSTKFLSAVSPKVATIEVGSKNTFGHPSPIVISRLENNGIKYYRTDADGDIEVVSDGNFFKVNKSK